MKKRFSEERIISFLWEAEKCLLVNELCRRLLPAKPDLLEPLLSGAKVAWLPLSELS
jgi:hypothetical protein